MNLHLYPYESSEDAIITSWIKCEYLIFPGQKDTIEFHCLSTIKIMQ